MTKAENVNPDGMYELMHAIIRQAMHDYEFALRGKKRFTTVGRAYNVAEMERFFLSQYGQMLCAGHGRQIIEMCRRKVAKKYGISIAET